MRRTRVLIADTEWAIIKYLRSSLEAREFEVLAATDGVEVLRIIETELPDVVIMNTILTKLDGFEVCSRLREWSQVPIIMIGDQQDETAKVKCLDLGADDYIAKPFGVNEILAQLRAMLRRTRAVGTIPVKPSFASDDFEINFAERRVTVAGNEVKLTPTEYSLLQELVLNVDKILTHTYLLNKIWGSEYSEEAEYLRVFVSRLREKIEPDPGNPVYIITVPGVGYQFKDAV